MARIRTIKPEFWTDEKIVQLPYEARLLFIGMWNFCDDEGYLWNEPERIRMQVLPNDDVDISGIIDLLSASGFIETYITDDDKRYIRIAHFSDHQKVDHPTKSKISREGSRKFTIPSNVRRLVAKKYGCKQGESIDVECYYCGSQGKINWLHTNKGKPNPWVSFSNLELDHLHPESKGGETTVDNIVLSCRECNRSKHNKDLFNFVVNTREDSRTLAPEGKGKEGNVKESKYNPPIPPTEEAKETKDQKNESQSDDCSVPIPESNFDIFWKHYPKKIGKDAARKAFEKKAKPPKETLEKIINALSWQRESEQWKKDGGNYIPNPATYLNQGRWQDERPPPTHHPPHPKNKRFDPINAINGGDGYGNAREKENRIINIGGGVAEEEQQRHLGYRSSF